MPRIEYACPHIDTLLDLVRHATRALKKRSGDYTLDDVEDMHCALYELTDSDWEERLEKVRSICETLREQRDDAQQELASVLELLEEANSTIEELEKKIAEPRP